MIIQKTSKANEVCRTKHKRSEICVSIFGLKRDITDKYYTKSSVVDICINRIREKLNIDENDLIIEPSAGDGKFIDKIKTLTKYYNFYDIKPEHNEIEEQDFLELETTIIQDIYTNIHIIGNPPFGRQSTLALQFIEKASKFATSISFILPKSFKKDSIKDKIPLNFELLYEEDLPENSFLIDNIEHDVPCVFQIWRKTNINRKKKEKLEPTFFKFVKKTENPDISFRRVGVNSGNISRDIDDKSEESHYFIKFTNGLDIKTNMKRFNIKYEFNNTVGPKSISKQELLEYLNKYSNDS